MRLTSRFDCASLFGGKGNGLIVQRYLMTLSYDLAAHGRRIGATRKRLAIGVVLVLGTCLPCFPAAADVLIAIDKARQRMTVTVDGLPAYSWPVSTGKRGYSTPAGTFRPIRVAARYFSRKWDDAPMPHSIFFTSVGHAIHGSYAVRQLGTRASHGCVRLAPGNAAMLFALVNEEGLGRTRIVISGAELRQPVRSTPRRAMRPRWPAEDGWGGGYEAAPAYPGPGYEMSPEMDYPIEPGDGWGWQ
jgi:hypothetical protein